MPFSTRFTRLAVLAAIGSVAGLTGCNTDKLLTVPTPDVVLPGDVSSAAALPNAYAAALGDFQVAYSGSSTSEGQVIFAGLLSDELMDAETFPTRLEVDRRTTQENNSSMLPIFQNAQRARATAELVSSRYVQFDPANSQRSEVQSLAAYMYTVFAENYCSGVPVSVVNADGTFTYGAGQTTSQMLTAAVAKFDSAIVVATAAGTGAAAVSRLNLARLGKARAQLDLDQAAAAATTVALVPTSYLYNIQHDENTGRQNNGVFSYTVTSKRFTVSNNEGGNGLNFVSALDPRIGVVRDTAGTTTRVPSVGFDNATPFFRTTKYTSNAPAVYGYLGTSGRGAPVTLASGVEARLIEAEAAFRAGDDATLLTKLNAARAAAKTYSDNTTVPAAVAPLTVADLGADATSRRNLVFRERAFDMYLTSHRLGDLRRLIRQYAQAANSVFPTGPYNPIGAAAGTTYANDVNLPIPFEERNNPSYTGCIDRNP